MMRRIIKEIASWVLAGVLSVLVLNAFTFFFYHPLHELNRNGGATPGLKVPNQWSLYGTEGWGIQTIDSMGYPNPDLPLDDDYYIVIGTSHVEGLNVGTGERVSDILNERMGYADTLKFYNIAHSGYDFDNIVRHFEGLVEEFPNMEGLIIEIRQTDYSAEQLDYAVNQIGYSESEDSIVAVMDDLDIGDRALIELKTYFPFFRLLTYQYAIYQNTHSDIELSVISEEDEEYDYSEYIESLDRVMALIRSEYQGPMLIVYHPEMSINADGSVQTHNDETYELFEDACNRYGIGFVNVGPYFEAMYYEHNYACYGFWNTTMMSGHINRYGHRIISDVVYDYFFGDYE